MGRVFTAQCTTNTEVPKLSRYAVDELRRLLEATPKAVSGDSQAQFRR